MVETDEWNMILSERFEDELVRELLDNEDPFLVTPQSVESSSESSRPSLEEATASSFISRVFSGPTISDIETALSTTYRSRDSEQRSISHASVSVIEKGFSKMENKYTLRIKSCGNVMADDGYKWRKYGQKSIKNSPNPRSYYRCTNPRCSAKKQVEKSKEDPNTLIVTYEGLHLHFTYTHFLTPQPGDYTTPHHTAKKPKLQTQPLQAQEPDPQVQTSPHKGPILDANRTNTGPDGTGGGGGVESSSTICGALQGGLLEDVVPFTIRNPPTNSTFSNGLSFLSSLPSSPSFSSMPWSPDSSFDLGVLPGILGETT